MAYEGPTGPTYPIDKLLCEYNLFCVDETFWDVNFTDEDVPVIRLCNIETSTNIKVKYEEE